MYISGNVARLFLNARAYAFTVADMEGMVDNLRVTNSEGVGGPPNVLGLTIGKHISVNGNDVVTLNVQSASFDPTNNPFAAPLLLAQGMFVVLQLFLNGISGVSWYAPSFHIIRIGQRIDVNSLQPVSFSGESSGAWLPPIV